jgi:predicted ATPase
MRKIPISGGPHSGKTTLLEALSMEYPDAYFVPEAATEVINRELAAEQAEPGYTPRVPWLDYRIFAPLVLQESLTLEAAIPDSKNLVFQDRSLIDTIACLRLNGVAEFQEDTWRQIRTAKYTVALFCEPVGSYTATEVRRETAEEARRTHDFLAEAYDHAGITVIHLPAVSVPERLSIIRAVMDDERLYL